MPGILSGVWLIAVTLQPLRNVRVLFSSTVSRWPGGQWEKDSPGCISEIVRCRKLKFGRDISWGCRCATSWCDLDLTSDLAGVTISCYL